MNDIRTSVSNIHVKNMSIPDCLHRVWDAAEYPSFVTHLMKVEAEEIEDGVQIVDMWHDSEQVTHTKAVRIKIGDSRIFYRQVIFSNMLTHHSGEWLFANAGNDTVNITLTHWYKINSDKINENNMVPEDVDSLFMRNGMSTLNGLFECK